MDHTDQANNRKRIEIRSNGPYVITGNIPLVIKTQVVSEYGEPLSWNKDGEIAASEGYCLCRCGQSSDKPFCDGTHNMSSFDGTETAQTNSQADRRETLSGSTKITIRMDWSLCTSAGFCANRTSDITEMANHTEDTQIRALAIAMIEHCPSGALTYTLDDENKDIEVDLPQQIAVTREITAQGVIQGPYWVTGGISIVRTDGQLLERRNRVMLCGCGHSKNKPLCDGSHRAGR